MTSHVSPPVCEGVGRSDEFGALVAPFRRELHAHCYRMLGTLPDADDALQETLLRAWRGLEGFEGRSSMRTWLYRIATNVCLSMIGRHRSQALPIDLAAASSPATAEWVTGGGWLDPYPTGATEGPEQAAERRETLELAFMAALQHLSPSQRAALVLREVLRFSSREVADMLGTTVAAVNSSLQRARRDVRARLPTSNQQSELRRLDGEVGALARAYVEAWELGDVGAVVGLLTAEATFQMPPFQVWFRGRDAIAEFLPLGPLRDRWKMLPTRANGQLAFACYAAGSATGEFAAHSIDVVEVRGRRISSITAFLRPDLITRFGHPLTLGVPSG